MLNRRVKEFAAAMRSHAPSATERALDRCSYGGPGLAFEALLDDLHEGDALLTDDELAEAGAIVTAFGVDAILVSALRGVRRDSDGRRRAVVFTVAHCETADGSTEALPVLSGL